ncbi:MAG TPA: prolyl oligopeptidase family serine peptidase, partial [Phycisphaerales bacterium]|nr:prolyl oligopeptidase family serine peptidase [Phycisphaerales bacterium]
GGSAGGLLMGAVTNMRPDLFKVVVAAVPFVDVINTMSDPTIPLTVTEWEQWGNPCSDETAFHYMLSYSPYDNVGAKAYPNILVLAGLNDPRVCYWEPAKWTAKMRALAFNPPPESGKPSVAPDRVLLLRTNMSAGHAGESDRYERLREIAIQYAFILDHLGINE